MSIELEKVFSELKRDSAAMYSEEGVYEKLKSGKKLRIKLGADPSRPDLHLGHSVVLRKLRALQELGHEIIFVIGDFTAMIGDPSGKSKTRPPLTFEETRENSLSYYNQVSKILIKEQTLITYNSEWLKPMNFADILTLAGKYTLARVMERDDFSNRYNAGQAIGLHELMYPLMQGYDSVALKADIEVGGTDQTFNLLVGRELQRDYGQPPQEVITFPLLPGLDGVDKMSKSLDNYIGIDEAPHVIYEKCMRVPDTLLEDYFRLTTSLDKELYLPLLKEDIRQAHHLYAKEIVTLYHGAQEAVTSSERYAQVAGGAVPEEIPTQEITPENQIVSLAEVLKTVGFADSLSDAKRLITGKGIKLDGQTAEDAAMTLSSGSEAIISRGKNRFIRVKIQ